MFKFGFSSDDDESSEVDLKSQEQPKLLWKDSNEIIYAGDNVPFKKISEHANTRSIVACGNIVKYVCSKEVIESLLKNENNSLDDPILKSEKNHSDLLPALYEGGFKIWECTYDLLNYMDEQNMHFENMNVLDLGCGAGIIGIATLLHGAKCYFQDYNCDVIQYITIPNVLLNNRNGMEKCKFFSGDWDSFGNLVQGTSTAKEEFDYIFTSETIYNTDCYSKLHQVFEKLLRKSGAIYLAAKSFYFGVGGGITLFQNFLDKQKVFKYTTCWKCQEGVNREILKIEFI